MKTPPNSLMRTTRRNITAALSVTMAGLLGLTTVPAVTNTQPVAHAADITTVEDFTIDDRGVVTGLTPDGKNKAIDDTNTLTIPAEVNGTQVTGIADNAFARLNLTHVDFSQVKNLDLIGKNAFRDNKIATIDWPETLTHIGEGAFSNNKLENTLELPGSVTTIDTDAFRANKISEAKLGDNIDSFGDTIFADNDAWVKTILSDGTTTAQTVTTTTYPGGFGHVVNPVTVTLKLIDEKTGNTITSDRVYGDDLTNPTEVFGKNQEATLDLPMINGYEPVTESPYTFTPDSDNYTIEAKYKRVDKTPVLNLGGGKNFDNGATIDEKALLDGVTAKDFEGNDITDKITVNPTSIDSTVSGAHDVYYTVRDSQGRETTKKTSVAVGINWADVEVGGGWTVGDFTYKGATLTGFSDQGKEKLKGGKTDLYIPKVNLEGKPVTGISNEAFNGKGLTSVKGGWGNVTSIGSSAFYRNKLTSLPEDWGKITSVGNSAFYKNELATLPDDWGNVASIGSYAFSRIGLETLPDDWGDIANIGEGAFSFNKLTSIPDNWGSITIIKDSAFRDNKLTSIPDDWGNITRIEDTAFFINELAGVPEEWGSVTSVGSLAFSNNKLTSLPDDWGNVTSIGSSAFSSNKLASIPKDWSNFTRIEAGVFVGNELTSLPDDWGNVTSIGERAFAINKLTSLPDDWGNVTSIKSYAFSDNKVTSLPKYWGNVTSIEEHAFENNKLVSLPDDWGKITSIKGYTFSHNELTSLPDDWGKITSIGGDAFSRNELTSLPDDWGNVTDIGSSAFSYNKLTSLPDNWGKITSIGGYAFRDNELTSIPDDWGNVTSIGNSAFYNNKLTSIPDDWGNVTSIGNSAFYNNKLTSIPDDWGKITSIRYGAFRDNELTSLPEDWGNITSIENNAFHNNKLTSLPDDWGNVASIGFEAFRDNDLTNLPDDWGNITSIGNRSFYSNELASLPSGWGNVTYIGSEAFFNISLEKVSPCTKIFVNADNEGDWTKTFSNLPGDKICVYTDTGENPRNIQSTDKVLINPLDVTIDYVDGETGEKIAGSYTDLLPKDKLVNNDGTLNHVAPGVFGYEIADTDLTQDSDSVTIDDKNHTAHITYTYRKLTDEEITNNTKVTVGIRENNPGKQYPLDGNDQDRRMTGVISLDRTGFESDPIENPVIRVWYSDPVFENSKVENINGKTIDVTNKPNYFEFTYPGTLNPGDKINIAYTTSHPKYVTPRTTTHTMHAEVMDTNKNTFYGSSLHQDLNSKQATFIANYPDPKIEINPWGTIYDYDAQVDGTEEYKDFSFVTDGLNKDGTNTHDWVNHTIRHDKIHRNVDKYTTTINIPRYAVSPRARNYETLKKEGKLDAAGYTLAQFNADENPGWVDNGNGTLTFTGNAHNTHTVPTTRLKLHYPGAEEDVVYTISGNSRYIPHNKPDTEAVLRANHTVNFRFSPRPVPPKGKILRKIATYPQYQGRYFSDNAHDRHEDFGWLLLYNGGDTTLTNMVINDKDLDERMYYSSINLPSSLDSVVTLYDKDDASIYSQKAPKGGKIDFTEHVSYKDLQDVYRVEIRSNKTIQKGESGAITLYSRLDDPDKKYYTDTDKREGDRTNPNRFENTMVLTSDEASGDDYDYKYISDRDAQIFATKTSDYANENLVGDEGTYQVGFTTTRKSGENLNDVKLVDVLPKGIDLIDYDFTDQFKKLPGVRAHHENNYNGTGRTAVIFEIPQITYNQYTPGNNHVVGLIDTKPSVLAWAGDQENEVFLQNDESVFTLLNTVDNKKNNGQWSYLPDGNWSRATDVMTLASGSYTISEKAIRTYNTDADGKETTSPWKSHVTTAPGQKIDYRLEVVNGTDDARSGIRIYDVLPFVGDKSLSQTAAQTVSRESVFANRVDSSRTPTIVDADGDTIEGLKVQYYNSDSDVPDYTVDNAEDVLSGLEWSDTPADNTKAIRVVSEDGVSIKTPARDKISVILPMLANNKLAVDEQGNEIPGMPHESVANEKAFNSFYYRFDDEKSHNRLIEGNRVSNTMVNQPVTVEFVKKGLPRSLNSVLDNSNRDKLEPLAGAVFEYQRKDGTVVTTVESDENGNVRFVNVQPQVGDKVVETSAPTGYKKSEETRVISADTIRKARENDGVATLSDMVNELIIIPPVIPKGNVQFTKHDADGKPLAGVIFELSRTGEGGEKLTYEARANDKGVVKFRGIPVADDYTLREIQSPNFLQNVVVSENDLEVVEDETTDMGVVVNDKAEVDLTKLGVVADKLIDAQGNKKKFGDFQQIDGTQLGGAELEVVDESGTVVGTVTTSNKKPSTVSDLKVGAVYEVRETKSPDKYHDAGLTMKFKVNAKGLLTDVDGNEFKAQKSLYVPNVRDDETSTLVLTKTDSTDSTKPLEGAEFELLKKDDKDKWNPVQERKTTDKNGQVSWDGLEFGVYKVREVSAASGYYNTNVEREFVVERYKGTTHKIAVDNKPLSAKVKKVDYVARGLQSRDAAESVIVKMGLNNAQILRDGNVYDVAVPLKGVTFDVLDGDSESAAVVEQLVTDKDGVAELSTKLDEDKTYYLRETSTVEGYKLLDKPVAFTPHDYAVMRGFDGVIELRVANSKETGRLIISKTIADTNELLTGDSAEFEVVAVEKTDGEGEFVHNGVNYNVKPGSKTRTVATDPRNALAVVDGLEFGFYIVKETKAPGNYVVDETPRLFEVSAQDSSHTLIQPNREEFTPPKVHLPSSGKFAVIGFLLSMIVAGAAAFWLRRRES